MSDEDRARPDPIDPLAALGQVTGELVHDLANEVQVLQGWAMLARGEAAAGQAPVNEAQRVVDISSRLGRMLRDMLETVSGQEVSPELTFDPHALTEATLNERIREMATLDVHYRCDLPEGIRVAGRASFWSRILTNLLTNASRYADSAVRVALSLREDDQARSVVLRVEDDGPGVAAPDRAEIFQPFWRGARGGTGLGLSSVAWSARELKGTARYATDSSLGGAAFEVGVPAAAPLPTRLAPEPSETPDRLRGMSLLLIDDDPSVRMALIRLMRRAGADVTEIDPLDTSESEILERIEERWPDVILMDVHLGDRGGIALWRQLVLREPRLAARVAFITGLVAGDATWIEADATGQPVLGKPFDLSELVQILTRLRSAG